MIISGFQVIDHKISELPQAGKVYNTSIIEVKGCRFAATVSVNLNQAEGYDPFLEAQNRAIEAALARSQKSDFQLYGRQAYGGGGGFSKGSGKGKDPQAVAAPGYIGSLFSKGLKEFGYKRFELQNLIEAVLQKPYEKDIENTLTNGQVAKILQQIERGERAPKSGSSNQGGASASGQSERTQSGYKPQGSKPAQSNTAQQAPNPNAPTDAQIKFFTQLYKKMGFKSQAQRDEYYAAYLQGKTRPETKEDYSHLIRWFKVDTVKLALGKIGVHDPADQLAWVNEYLNKSFKRIEDCEGLTGAELKSVYDGLDSQAALV